MCSLLSILAEGDDFIKVNRVELKMPMDSDENATACTDVVIVNDTDIEEKEEFIIILETVDSAVKISLKFSTLFITADPNDGKLLFILVFFLIEPLYFFSCYFWNAKHYYYRDRRCQ